MLALDQIESTLFAPFCGQNFRIVEPGLELDLELIEVTSNERRRRGQGRVPFALLFRGAGSECLPQRIYRFEHGELGPMEIFIVPIGRDEKGFLYEAVFN